MLWRLESNIKGQHYTDFACKSARPNTAPICSAHGWSANATMSLSERAGGTRPDDEVFRAPPATDRRAASFGSRTGSEIFSAAAISWIVEAAPVSSCRRQLQARAMGAQSTCGSCARPSRTVTLVGREGIFRPPICVCGSSGGDDDPDWCSSSRSCVGLRLAGGHHVPQDRAQPLMAADRRRCRLRPTVTRFDQQLDDAGLAPPDRSGRPRADRTRRAPGLPPSHRRSSSLREGRLWSAPRSRAHGSCGGFRRRTASSTMPAGKRSGPEASAGRAVFVSGPSTRSSGRGACPSFVAVGVIAVPVSVKMIPFQQGRRLAAGVLRPQGAGSPAGCCAPCPRGSDR